jgi:hypothetical protein
MERPLRHCFIAAALVAAAGCATKPPPPEATPAPKPTLQSLGPGGSEPPKSASTEAAPGACAQTSDERRAALDKQLNDSLGSFDAKLRKEQQKIAQQRDARRAAVVTVSTDDKPASARASADPAGSAGADVPARGEKSSASRPGDLKSDKSAVGASGAAGGNGAVASEIPDGNDDDIVARRLRKAAEQETDPELKEKLWKEYVEYKKNAQGT